MSQGEMTVALQVNGVSKVLAIAPNETLLETLRRLPDLKGTRFGCGAESCGACLVLLDGAPTYACTFPTASVANAGITTIEGLGDAAQPHPIQQAFIDLQAGQCGYCLSGIMLSVKALLDRNPRPDRAAVMQALDRHLCRCGSHARILRAVERSAELMAQDRA